MITAVSGRHRGRRTVTTVPPCAPAHPRGLPLTGSRAARALLPSASADPTARGEDHEAAVVLFALDVASERMMPNEPEAGQIRTARQLMTAKLWPELGDLLDDGEVD